MPLTSFTAPCILRAAVLGTLLVCLQVPYPLVAVEGATNLAEESLLADDPSMARAAFDAQAANPDHRAHLRVILRRLEIRLTDRIAQDRRTLTSAIAVALTPQALEPLTTADRELQVAARALLGFAFDDKRYPVPAKAHTGWYPGIDIQPGQEALEKLYAEAFAKYDQLQALQHSGLLALVAALEPGAEKPLADNPQPPLPLYLQKVEAQRQVTAQWTAAPGRLPENRPLAQYTLRAPDLTCQRLLALLADRARALRTVARKIDELRDWRAELDQPITATRRNGLPADDERPSMQPFADLPPAALALLALSEEHYARAARHAAEPTPAGFSIFWQSVCDLTALVHNAAAADLREHERWHLREINLYRYSLGLRPLIHNERLQTAAQKHGERMRDRKFFGHYDPDSTRQTPQLRALHEGYEGMTGENIAGGQDGWRSLWRWRSDAGHHRVLIHPLFCEAGFSEVSDNETLDTGAKPTHLLQNLFEKRVASAETAPAPAASRPSIAFRP